MFIFATLPKRLKILLLGVLCSVAWLSGCDAPASEVRFKEGRMIWGETTLQLEIADSDTTRQVGLMFREQLPPGSGMWFEFEQPARQCMWMRNTLIDLDVAFVDSHYRVTNIERMLANTESPHCATGKVQFALEVNAGWFKKHGLTVGARLSPPVLLTTQ